MLAGVVLAGYALLAGTISTVLNFLMRILLVVILILLFKFGGVFCYLSSAVGSSSLKAEFTGGNVVFLTTIIITYRGAMLRG